MKSKAIWFSRHQPTEKQLAEALDMGYEIMAIEDGMRLGAIQLTDDGDVKAVLTALFALIAEHKAEAIFGVPSTPVMRQMRQTANDAILRGWWNESDILFYAAWNVDRAPEGQKPQFHHKRWELVGRISNASLRWIP